MGSVFPHIADWGLQPSEQDEACQHCGAEVGIVYDFNARIVDPSLAATVEPGQTDLEIFAACADCIKGGNLRKLPGAMSEIRPVINAFAADRHVAAEQYHQIPDIPLMMQYADWPICCGHLSEFQGNPETYEDCAKVPEHYQFWDRRPNAFEFSHDLQPEVLREVCLFRCSDCGKQYFIWQPT